MKSNGLKFEEETVATPAEITFCNNKIWSGNAGRTANCLMVGDIRAIKKTVTIKWYHLTGEQTAQINKYISNVDSPFFNATLLDETFNEIKIRVNSNAFAKLPLFVPAEYFIAWISCIDPYFDFIKSLVQKCGVKKWAINI